MMELLGTAGNRWLKRIWFVDGIVFFVLIVFGVGAIVFPFVSDWHGSKQVAGAAPSPNAAPADNGPLRAVRFDLPAAIRGTNTRLVLVRSGSADLSRGGGLASSRLYDPGYKEGTIVNVAFLPPNGGQARLLFNQSAFLTEVVFPGSRYEPVDSLQTWIMYRAVLTDTNGDGKLDSDDEQQLLVSDLDGSNVKRVLPSGWRLREYEPLADHKTLIITAYELPKPSDGRFDEQHALERAFLYDIASGKLESFSALDSAVARAAHVVLGAPPTR